MATNTGSGPRYLTRPRSSSITGPASPESQSSDSPSSSDPDTHLAFSHTTISKSLFSMEVDSASNPHMMGVETDISFDTDFELHQMDLHRLQAVDTFQDYNVNLDDIALGGLPNMNPSTKVDMLMLEEIIKDGAFEPSPTVGPPFQSHSSRSPVFGDSYISLPHPLAYHPHHSHSQTPPGPVCIEPSSIQSTQIQSRLLATSLASSAITSSPLCKAEPTSVPLLSPASQATSGAPTPLKIDPFPSHTLLSYDSVSSTLISCEVVHPHMDVCLDLPIFFPSIPTEGTKSRVETQIKLTFELGFPKPSSPSRHSTRRNRAATTSSSHSTSSSSSVSNSPSISPVPSERDNSSSSQPPTHDKVGTYKFLRLPQGTATKRRAIGFVGAHRDPDRCEDVKVEDTLNMIAQVMCCSSPHALVQSCSSCQSREAKRTARKLAARVRPPHGTHSKTRLRRSAKKGKQPDSDAEEHATTMTEDEADDEPNADASIIQFNCAEIVDFRCGSAVLPMRITCYCRHHKEKVGFNIVFTLRDHLGRIVGRGTTPPILITDDHKSTNAVSKLPPMHPLRQALNPPLLSLSSLAADHPEETKSLNPQSPPDQGLNHVSKRRRDADSVAKKRRPKPYDGRPINRTAGIGPGIEGRQGVVLALHPAHAKQKMTGSAREAMNPSEGPTTFSGVKSHASPPQRANSLPSPVHSEKLSSSPPPSVTGILTPQRDANFPTLEHGRGLFHSSPPLSLSGFLPTAPPSPSLPSPNSSQSEYQAIQHPTLPVAKLQAVSSGKVSFDSYSPHQYSSLDPTISPKIHRLIPSSGPTTGGIEITILGSNFHASLPLECVFGGAVASSTHRWSDTTLVCVLPPRATPGIVGVGFSGVKDEGEADGSGTCLFNYVDESDRQLMELALQVVGLKMTGKIEEARSVAMRIVGNTNTPTSTMTNGETLEMNSHSGTHFTHHSFLGSLGGMDLETLIIKLLTLLDVPPHADATTPLSSCVIGHQNATGQTLLHLAVILELPALVSCLAQRSIDLDARNNNGLTALHFAAMTGWKEGAEILLAAGADASIVDRTGFTPTDRARYAQSPELEKLLEQMKTYNGESEGESGEDGDDEAWHSEDVQSEKGISDAEASGSWHATASAEYIAQSRIKSLAESSEKLREPARHQPKNPSGQIEITHSDNFRESVQEKRPLDEKHEASFVGRLQRTLPQGILTNVQIPGFPQLQIPGFPQLQLSDMLAGPWGALPQIPVFPVFVPIPNLPHLPNWPAFSRADGEKKESPPSGEIEEKQQQQPQLAFPTFWAAYDNFTNNAWRAQWEKWTAHVTALQDVRSPSAESPPVYTPREQGGQSKSVVTTPSDDAHSVASGDTATADASVVASTSHSPTAKATRRVGYGAVKVPDTEVNSYHYQPKKFNRKKDRMLVLFWIPILFIGLAYAFYITVPAAVAGLTRATKRLALRLPQQDEPPV